MNAGHLISVETEDHKSSLLVRVTGELDMASAPELSDSIEAIDWDQYDRVVVDLGEISFIDSSGLGALIALRNQHPGTEMALVTANQGVVANVLELTSMKDLFPIYPSAEAALS